MSLRAVALTAFIFSAALHARAQEAIGHGLLNQAAKRISPEIYSIGAITLHLCECEYYWFQSVVRERELTDEEQKFAHMFDAMENDVDRGFDAEYLLVKLNAIYKMTYDHLRTLDDSALDRYFVSRYGDRNQEFSLREILQRMADHEANHRGQMAMIKRVLRNGPTL